MKPKWEKATCGCTKANLTNAGRVMIRCSRHKGKPSKRVLCHFEDGMVRRG